MSKVRVKIPPMGGCLSLVAMAVISACGGAQRDAGSETTVASSPTTVPASPTLPSSPAAPATPTTTPSDPTSTPVSTMTNTVPAVDTAKIPTGVAGASTVQIQATSEPPASSDGTGAFRTACQFSHMAFDDPIVFPGQPGRSHLHVFFGNTATNASSTATSIATTGNSTCLGGTINRTAYWAPAMIDTKDGSPVVPNMLGVYYKTGYAGVNPAVVQPMPAGLRMIAGTSTASTAGDGGAVSFVCVDSSGSGARLTSIPTTCAVGNTIWARVVFPQCWDGVNLDSPDHKSHMAYPSGGCPSTHPVALPEVTINVLYQITDASAPARWRLASDNYDQSLPAGYSMHADWFNGWNPVFMDSFVRGCEQPAKDCHAHLLGNGEMML